MLCFDLVLNINLKKKLKLIYAHTVARSPFPFPPLKKVDFSKGFPD